MINLLNVIIIDDEPLVRVGLKSMLPWEELGYRIIGEATNGETGLELIIKHKPDIVITDIKMPVMDGLEMMRLAIRAEQSPKFIILSSHDQFQLVKQAMKQGAEEYLIKLDLEPEILINTLSSIREKILNERNKANDNIRFEKDLKENLNILREGFFKRIINRPVQSESLLVEQAAYLGIELGEGLACALIQINNLSVFEKYDSKEIHLFENSILNTINEIVNDIFCGYTFTLNQGQFVIVFSGDNITKTDLFLEKARNMGERLVNMLKQYFNIITSVGISNLCHGYLELPQAYLEGCRAAQYGFYSGTQSVIFFQDLPKSNDAHEEQVDFSELKNSIPKAIELHDLEMIKTIFDKVISILHESKVTREQAYDLCFQIAYLVNNATGLNDMELKKIIGYSNNLYESILTLDTLVEIIHWLTGLEQRLREFITVKDEQKNHRVINKAKKYILEHYMGEINLNDVASAINISAGYLSTIFKQYTGVCFTDFVTEVKMEEAKKLLRETGYKIYEIAEMLGYQNAYYFSKVFKKITGMTPSEFSGKQI